MYNYTPNQFTLSIWFILAVFVISEFIPYVFQLLSLLLELHESGTIPEPYMVLFPCLLVPVLWDRPGNIHPLVRLLRAFIHKGAAQIAESQKIVRMLKIHSIDFTLYFLCTLSNLQLAVSTFRVVCLVSSKNLWLLKLMTMKDFISFSLW